MGTENLPKTREGLGNALKEGEKAFENADSQIQQLLKETSGTCKAGDTTDPEKSNNSDSPMAQHLGSIIANANTIEARIQNDPDPAHAIATTQKLRAALSNTLGQLADNNVIEQAAKAHLSELTNARDELRQDRHFSPDQVKTLVDGVTREASSVKGGIDGLHQLREGISTALEHTQSDEDYFRQMQSAGFHPTPKVTPPDCAATAARGK